MPFTIERNDLANMQVDAVVVAANERLQITGGVGGAVAMAAGLNQMQAACDAIGYCPTGQAVATPGFALPAKTVVHVVGPVWMGGEHGEAHLLRSAYDNALATAIEEGAESIALPLISAGSYGFPPELSLSIAREAVRAFLNDHDADVRLVLYGRKDVQAGLSAYLDIAEYIDDHYVDEQRVASDTTYPLNLPRPLPESPAYGSRESRTADARDYAFREDAPERERGWPDSAPMPTSGGRPSYSAPTGAPRPAEKSKRPGIVSRIGGALAESRERRRERLEERAKPEPDDYADASFSAAYAPIEAEDAEGRIVDAQSFPAHARDRITCAHCGNQVRAGAVFCQWCGSLLQHDSETSTPVAQETAPVPGAAASRPAPAAPAEAAAPAFAYDASRLPLSTDAPSRETTGAFAPVAMAAAETGAPSLEDLLDSLDEPFSTTLLALIDARGYTDAQVYKRANMSRQLFSKIRSDAHYRPTKRTALALAVALQLNLDETDDLLRRAGYALSSSSKADVIVEYHILHGNYDIFQINEALYAFDQPLL